MQLKMSRSFIWTCLGVIIIIASVLRFYQLGKVPVSLYWDEVAIGYNAYSIAHTGKDEYGKVFPLLFRSYDDYKMPGQMYLTAIPVAIFGLNEFAVRFPSAFLGVLSVIFLYFFVRDLFQKFAKDKKKYPELVGLASALMLAISPWHIQFSRAGFEANSGLFFLIFSAWLFIKGLDSGKYRVISFFVFTLSLYFYRSLLIVVPILVVVCLVIFARTLLKKTARLYTVIGVALFVILAIPIMWVTFAGSGLVRAEQVSAAGDIAKQLEQSSRTIADSPNISVGKIVLNRRFETANVILKNYLTHFSAEFLFFSGDVNGRHGARGMGMLYLWEIVTLIVGFIVLTRLPWRVGALLISWLLIAPIPASLSLPVPHALRDLNAVPVFCILSAIGLVEIYLWLEKRRFGRAGIAVGIVVILFFFAQFLYLYFSVSPKLTASDWGDGYKQLVSAVSAIDGSYNKVVVTGAQWEPYTYFLFYTQYDPAKYQASGSSRGFDKYIFGGTSWDKAKYSVTLDQVNLEKFAGADNALIVLSPQEYQAQKDNVSYIKTISNSDGTPLFIITSLKKLSNTTNI